MMKRSPLSRVEGLIRRVVEEPFTWLAGDVLDAFKLAAHLIRMYQEPRINGALPNQFTVYLSAGDLEALSTDLAALEFQVGDYMKLLAERRGLLLGEAPRIHFVAGPDETPGRARVAAGREDSPELAHTDILSVETNDKVLAAIRAADAFLIVGGQRHVPLDRPLTRIGRRVDNDLVFEMPSISRQHAQIRWRQRYFVLYDVSGHGRTTVNGIPTREHILRSGDVIGLSDVMLVYGEGRDDVLGNAPSTSDEELDTTLLKPDE